MVPVVIDGTDDTRVYWNQASCCDAMHAACLSQGISTPG